MLMMMENSVLTCIHGKVKDAVPQRLAIVLPWPNAQAALYELISQWLQLLLHHPGAPLLFTTEMARLSTTKHYHYPSILYSLGCRG